LFTAVALAAVILALRRRIDPDAQEDTAMTNGAYKAWIDSMPIDDVRRRIDRLEQKLADLQALERLYTERQPSDDEAVSEASDDGASEHVGEEV
jgi:hypothetical protein